MAPHPTKRLTFTVRTFLSVSIAFKLRTVGRVGTFKSFQKTELNSECIWNNPTGGAPTATDNEILDISIPEEEDVYLDYIGFQNSENSVRSFKDLKCKIHFVLILYF